jgi:hypothetical protein
MNTPSAADSSTAPEISCRSGHERLNQAANTNANSRFADSSGSTSATEPSCNAQPPSPAPTDIAAMPSHHSRLVIRCSSSRNDSSSDSEACAATRCCSTQPRPRHTAATRPATKTISAPPLGDRPGRLPSCAPPFVRSSGAAEGRDHRIRS